MRVTSKELSFFDENGYIVINDVFKRHDVESFQNTLASIIKLRIMHLARDSRGALDDLKSKELSIDDGLRALSSIDHYQVAFVQRLISRSPAFFRLTGSSIVEDILKQLLRMPSSYPIYLLSNGIVFSVPNDSLNTSANLNLDWHKDTFFTIPKSRFYQVWVPLLHDSNQNNGSLVVCPGSHKEGVGQQLYNSDSSFNYRFSVPGEDVQKYSPISIDVNLSDILIFDGNLIHASGHNTSKQVKCSMIGLCHDASRKECIPVSTDYLFYEQTPESYFYECFGDENILPIANRSLAFKKEEPVGGV